MGKYWMVHRPGWPGNPGGPPTVKHVTFEAAAKEAMRLARKDLARFIVLEAVASYRPSREQDPISLDIECIGDGPTLSVEDSWEREGCSCSEGHDEEPDQKELDTCSAVEEHDPGCFPSEPEESTPIEVGDVHSRCSCYWCDPENHDVEDCEFPNCGCKQVQAKAWEVLETQIEGFDELIALLSRADPTRLMESMMIQKVDCPCGCTKREAVKYPEPLDQGAADLRREWMGTVDLSSSYAGWDVEDFESALANNLDARSDLCAGLLRLREALSERSSDAPDPEHDCGGQPAGAHWCPHCGDDLRVERPMGTGLEA